jgi:gluconokinase
VLDTVARLSALHECGLIIANSAVACPRENRLIDAHRAADATAPPAAQRTRPATALIVMGVTGSGKSTVGAALAQRLGWQFIEGDALHPRHNVAKMRRGEPLDDDDRRPWLALICEAINQGLRCHPGVVASCSALRRRYREQLLQGCPGLRFLLLHGPRELLRERLQARRDHFMPAALLTSQLDTLELPSADEPVVTLDIGDHVEALVARALQGLTLHGDDAGMMR